MFLYHLTCLAISLAVLVWGADKFVDNSSLVAKRLGLSELTIGLTIVALGTSAPEIFVGISSVLNGTEELAMGTVVGSNISNIALIFGVSCIGLSTRPAKTPFIQFVPFILGAIILGISLVDLKITSAESWIFLGLFLVFIYVTYIGRRADDKKEVVESSDFKTSLTIFFLIIGLLALIGGSNYAVIHAEKIAIMLNVPQLIIGLTIIAIGTSLPELAATISAIMKNKNDMVIGNVIGSNVMNIALVVPIIGIFSDTTSIFSVASNFATNFFGNPTGFIILVFVIFGLSLISLNLTYKV